MTTQPDDPQGDLDIVDAPEEDHEDDELDFVDPDQFEDGDVDDIAPVLGVEDPLPEEDDDEREAPA